MVNKKEKQEHDRKKERKKGGDKHVWLTKKLLNFVNM